jgi:hypothetical protein
MTTLRLVLGVFQAELQHLQIRKKLSGVLAAFRADGLSQRAMVVQLNGLGISATNGGRWSLLQFQRVLKRLEAHAE